MAIPESKQDLGENKEPLICLLYDEPVFAPLVNRDHIERPQAVTGKTLVVFHHATTYPLLERLVSPSRRSRSVSLIAKLGRFLEYRRNPRNMTYMTKLATNSLPTFDPLKTSSAASDCNLATVNWREIGQVILFWPDANGTGWFPIERRIFSHKVRFTPVHVLNGRGRFFELKRSTLRGYRLRRVLEKSFLLEAIVVIIFLTTSPFMALWDWCTNREQ